MTPAKAPAKQEMKRLNHVIGAEVRRLRKESGLGQVEFAVELGLDQSALSRIESGKQVLTAPQWVLLCKRLDVIGDYLTAVTRTEVLS